MFAYSSRELGPSLLFIAAGLVVIALIAVFVVWRGKRRGSRTLVIDAALTVSGWWVTLSALSAIVFVIKIFATDWAEIASTPLWIPWPSDLACSDEFEVTGAVLQCGGGTIENITVRGASLGLRALAGAAQISSLAFATMPAAMIMVICFQTLRGRAFSQTVSRALTIGGIGVLAFGLASDIFGSIAATAGLREVFPPDSEWYPMTFQLSVTPLPLAGALGLIALAAVFRQGLRLEQEKLSLQQERDSLLKDTQGLV